MKFSFIIPVYNVEKFLPECIESILTQTYVNYEIILIDDGSPDGSGKICDEYANCDNRIKVIHKKNGGVSSARNTGLNYAQGEYIIFLDGDDYIDKELLQTIYEYLVYDKADIICWGYDKVSQDHKTIDSYFEKFRRESENMTGVEAMSNIIIRKTMWICTGSAAFNKNYLKDKHLQYTVGCPNGEDQEFTYKALAQASKVLFIDEILTYYVQRTNSISNSYNIERLEAVKAINRVIECIKVIKNSNDKMLAMITEKLEGEVMLGLFIYNYNSCLNQMLQKGISTTKAFKQLDKDIKNYYNDLDVSIRTLYKELTSKKLKVNIWLRIYILSPMLHAYLFKLRNVLKNKKS